MSVGARGFMGGWRVVSGLLLFWLVVLIYMSSTFLLTTPETATERAERSLAKALQELEALKAQNGELKRLAEELRDMRLLGDGRGELSAAQVKLEDAESRLARVQSRAQQAAPANMSAAPVTRQHEELMRQVYNGQLEMWYFMRSQLKKMKKENGANSGLVSHIDSVMEDFKDHHMTILTDIYNLSLSNGAGVWREREAADLGALVQQRLHKLQNPADCSSAKKLVCNLNKGCGYGCQLHHLVYCFMIAYGTERTLILESRGWRYAPGGWETFFLPLSEKCLDRGGKSVRGWGPPEVINDVQVVELPIVDSLHPRPPFMPLAVPEDLAARLIPLHGHPAVWWISQLMQYLLRPQPQLQQDMEETVRRLRFSNPIVGVHVRRTDKVGTEAAFHAIEEYMEHVDLWFDLREKFRPVAQRQIYLATDDPNLLEEARQKFPHYNIISDNSISRTAGLGSRYSESSLRGVIMDIHMLSLTDYLVCTFSSQVCRVAYEIMQTRHPDAARAFYSLDDIYYFGGQNAHNQVAVYAHTASRHGEIDLMPGDLVGVAGNHWDGYSKGMNKRTGKTGLYPSYKVRDRIDIIEFPTYGGSR